MSIETVRSRIGEIESRLRAISPEPPLFQAAEAVDTPPRRPVDSPSSRPFNVELSRALGEVKIRPAGELSSRIEELVSKYSAIHGLDPALVKAVVQAESSGNPATVSSKGAMGLMQIMPDEVKQYGIRDPFDLEQNIAAGTRQLSEKLAAFHGNLKLALAAYNAGIGAVRRHGGVPPYPETEKYVQKILGALGGQR